jgi:hypothetical protein
MNRNFEHFKTMTTLIEVFAIGAPPICLSYALCCDGAWANMAKFDTEINAAYTRNATFTSVSILLR